MPSTPRPVPADVEPGVDPSVEGALVPDVGSGAVEAVVEGEAVSSSEPCMTMNPPTARAITTIAITTQISDRRRRSSGGRGGTGASGGAGAGAAGEGWAGGRAAIEAAATTGGGVA